MKIFSEKFIFCCNFQLIVLTKLSFPHFSRMTSGMISPSDLPDSPIHTVPVSPSPRSGAKFTFPPGANLPRGKNPAGENTGKFPSGVASSGVKGPHQRPSVFEDTVATYKDEDDEMEESGGE